MNKKSGYLPENAEINRERNNTNIKVPYKNQMNETAAINATIADEEIKKWNFLWRKPILFVGDPCIDDYCCDSGWIFAYKKYLQKRPITTKIEIKENLLITERKQEKCSMKQKDYLTIKKRKMLMVWQTLRKILL
jgi:hypothetical protein